MCCCEVQLLPIQKRDSANISWFTVLDSCGVFLSPHESLSAKCVCPGSKNVKVFTVLLTFLASVCTGTTDKMQPRVLAPTWTQVVEETVRLFSDVSSCMSDLFSFSFEWIWRILAGYTTRKTDDHDSLYLYRYKYPRQTPFSFSRAFLCAVWDMCPVYFTWLLRQEWKRYTFFQWNQQHHRNVFDDDIFPVSHTQCFTISSILEQYSFLTGNQCPQWHYSKHVSSALPVSWPVCCGTTHPNLWIL